MVRLLRHRAIINIGRDFVVIICEVKFIQLVGRAPRSDVVLTGRPMSVSRGFVMGTDSRVDIGNGSFSSHGRSAATGRRHPSDQRRFRNPRDLRDYPRLG